MLWTSSICASSNPSNPALILAGNALASACAVAAARAAATAPTSASATTAAGSHDSRSISKRRMFRRFPALLVCVFYTSTSGLVIAAAAGVFLKCVCTSSSG
jgi:hypothetical protein